MKDIKILCVGKIKEKYFREGIEYYVRQIKKKYPVEVVECADEATPDKASETEELQIKDKEGRKLLQMDVNTMRYQGKNKTRYTKSGLLKGRKNAFKKAIVTLKEGDTIDFYSNI